ncbi:MAG TPA: glycosyltransferase family 1 protein [Sedimenticola sp.]|nr:glycosyltransferase family 1 protein [Sedimenticola sp.]
MDKRFVKTKILFVLPIQSPYLTERLKKLASYSDIEIVLLLESAELANRPGWRPQPIPGVVVEVWQSLILSNHRMYPDLGYEIKGMRSVPWRLPLALWRHRPSVVVVCNATQLLFSLPLKPFLGYKIYLTVEDTPHSIRNKSTIVKFFKTFVYRQADLFLAYSEMATEFLSKIVAQNRVRRTSWSVDLKWFKPDQKIKDDFKEKLGVSDQVIFLFAGALIPGKGVMPLLRGWAKLTSAERNKSILLVAGTGSQELEAKAYVELHSMKEINFLGHLSYSDMRAAFIGCDIFVLPTLQDLFSLVVLEAMACGCPVLTTPYNGASELIEKGETGWLFDVANEESICDALRQAIKHRNELVYMEEKARERVSEMDNDIVMRKLAEILQESVK